MQKKQFGGKRAKAPKNEDYDDYEEGPSKKIKHQNSETKIKVNKKDYSKKDGKFGKSEKSEKGEKGADVKQFHELNKLYNQLMSKKPEKKTKKSIIDEVLRLTSGILPQIARKHDGCRVVQGCLKYGEPQQKEVIMKAFLNNDIFEHAKSKYGHFLLIKMTEHFSKKQLNQAFELLMKNVDQILHINEAGKTIEAFLKAGADKSIFEKYTAPILNIKIDDATTHEKLENTALKIAEKKAFYYPIQQKIMAESLKILIPDEKAKILETVVTETESFLHTKEGALLVCNAIDYMDVKERKTLLKTLKPKVKELLAADKNFLHIILIKILSVVDDTVLIKKTIINEIVKDLEELINKPHIHDVLLSIYDESDEDYLAKYLPQATNDAVSKKDAKTRRNELIEYTIESLINVFSFQLKEYIANPKLSKLLYFVLKNILDNNREEHFQIITTTIDIVIEDYNKNNKEKDLEHKILIAHPQGQRLVKNIIAGYQNYLGDAKQFYSEIIEKIYEFAIKELPVLLQTKAIFIIIALIENTEYKDQIIQEINQQKHILKSLKGSGLEILKGLL